MTSLFWGRNAIGIGIVICAVTAVLLANVSYGEDAAEDDWISTARAAGLSDEDIGQVRTNGILVTNESYNQVYVPYVERTLPVFVTSDSLLNAYHVLYEESIRRMEQANAQRLPDILRFILANLDGASDLSTADDALVAAAQERATIVVATALKLLDDSFEVDDASLRATVEEEVARIVVAQANMKPAWLGPPESDFISLDYTRYRVRGFYTCSDTLSRYFRAVAWLQSIPFRVSHDDELLSILMLGGCLTPDRFGGDPNRCAEYRGFFRIYKEFLGVNDDWDIIVAADEVGGMAGFDLTTKRADLVAKAQQEGGPQINDQLRFAPEDPNVTAEPNFRIVSAYRIPDSVLFQRTTDIRVFRGRRVPNGLEVCMALGSTFARDQIEDSEKPKLLETIDELKALFAGSSLYLDYLDAVAVLLDPPEPNAPAFMEGDAWKAKSCGTVLGGWAQLRHSWVLQAKEPVYISGVDRSRPTAFIEAEPEFFRRMAQLAARTRQLLVSAEAFGPDYLCAVNSLTEIVSLLEQSENDEDFWQQFESAFFSASTSINGFLANFAYTMEVPFEAKADRIRALIADLERGVVAPSVESAVTRCQVDIDSLWDSFEQTSQRLASISQKVLLGLDPNDTEEAFLSKNYGSIIAEIVLLGGTPYSMIPDDAPRIVAVYTAVDDSTMQTSYLHAGIGRARALYVLYPFNGVDILCKGAVLPYYEFVVEEGRLTDAEWKGILDGPDRPDVPSWLAPIIGAEGLSAP